MCLACVCLRVQKDSGESKDPVAIPSASTSSALLAPVEQTEKPAEVEPAKAEPAEETKPAEVEPAKAEPAGETEPAAEAEEGEVEKDHEMTVQEPHMPSTSAAASSPAASSPAAAAASSSSSSSEVTEILRWSQFIVQNLVPLSSPLYNPKNPGLLLSDLVVKGWPLYYIPFQLVWLYDEAACAERQERNIASYLQTMPVLPYWMVNTDGNDECVPRSFMLADCIASENGRLTSLWPQTFFALRRSSITGAALDAKEEAKSLEEYRHESVSVRNCSMRRAALGEPSVRHC